MKRVIGVVGMPGSGKGVLDRVAGEYGFATVVMGDVIREEANRRGLEPTPENMGRVMLKLREEEGDAVVAERCIPKILGSASEEVVVVEGVRSLEEVLEFKRSLPDFTLVAIHASPETRFRRIYSRERSDDPASWEAFWERDLRELGVGIGSAVAIADHVIVNEGPIDHFEGRIREFFEAYVKSTKRPVPS